ncbi:hypothetical protein CSOJ01_03649 [Colletotrichum sojae]|uniref:Nephrocystin 3-like N-terminal domain-containing protein n=1 Tax=Colletotrichum sojae TaxID=2175907 RepID=A0A8H6JLP1_9PEZI|nr:hypothetical protein CSOJ01_03649 [Colletotrichum sojae]
MDPVTAIVLASGILAFVEISAKVISGTLEVARSGSLAENAHVGAIVDDLQQAAGELKGRLPDHSRHAESLNSLASECRSVADELQGLLQKLKVECGSSKWKPINVTIRSMRKGGNVAQLEGRLEKCRSQILLRLMMILNERQTTVQVQLSGMESQSASRSANIVHQLDGLRHDILSAMENQKNNHEQIEATSDDSDQAILLGKLSTSVNALLDGSLGPSPDVRVLKQLYFPTVYSREDTMETATESTFRWILEEGFDETFGEDDLGSGDEEDDAASNNSGDDHDAHSENNLEEKPAKSETEEEIRKRTAKENRVQARARFTTWLETTESSTSLGSQAQGTGGKLQKSLEGLQRSILFETLKQCPELVEQVFPEAYSAFSRNSAASTIDELYFRPRELNRAINKLASVPTAMGYRICFFIDGLDEYEDADTDELHHEKLAEQICSWATNDDVKILVSSRPYRVFQEAFVDERRIRVQDLTGGDVALFARKMFEKDKNFDQVRPYYHQLVDKVVRDSAGVFLWARLTMRSLIMATRRNCSQEFLERQLDQTPRSISVLYAQLLASINAVDREKAYKMLLLVARANGSVSVLAHAWTWINSLENPDFPMCSKPRVYTDEEAGVIHRSIRQELEDSTKGLLEITTDNDPTIKDWPLTTEKVQFFHRTVLDFVRESDIFHQVSARYPKLGNEEMIVRMLLAEMWFIEALEAPCDRSEALNYHFRRMPPSQTRDNYLDAFERVLSSDNAVKWDDSFRVKSVCPGRSIFCSRREVSFVNWAAAILESPEYVIQKLEQKPHLVRSRDNMCLVLSAAFRDLIEVGDPSSYRLTPLFEIGISPNEKIGLEARGHPKGMEGLAPKTCWAVFCTFFAMKNVGWRGRSRRMRLSTQLEDIFSTGEVDSHCVILLSTYGNGLKHDYDDEEPQSDPPAVTHYIYLSDLISRLSSDNHDSITRLVSGSNWRPWKSCKRIWNYASGPENDLSALASIYPVCDDKLLFSDTTQVVSLVWENEQVERTNFQIAIY